ncbi:hypothetical protein L3Q82_013674 [Scortum barcoo]|uniref:Uncharacterized protein n=1 Tax=Scortum barcoo TaxID=214431 RepID=A0ACB8W0Z4_9TELE|nr:hypothetical protein L3Q82_013674 [Scortum barcoo]
MLVTMWPFPSQRRTVSAVLLGAVVLCVSFVSRGDCQTTPRPATPCSAYSNCDTCVPHAKCLWCFTTNNCTEYPVTWLLPPASVCQLSQARWGVCWLNFEALIIALAVLGGTILICIIVCCCCCCCCKKRQSRISLKQIWQFVDVFNLADPDQCVFDVHWFCNPDILLIPPYVSSVDRDEERFARRREEIKQRAEERKVERKARHDEIRRKYEQHGSRLTPGAALERLEMCAQGQGLTEGSSLRQERRQQPGSPRKKKDSSSCNTLAGRRWLLDGHAPGRIERRRSGTLPIHRNQGGV